jgi:transcriptional regulator with XRE-family HTH domain
MTTAPMAFYEKPVGHIIREKRKSMRWSIRQLLEGYVRVIIEYDRERAEKLDLDRDPLMLTETDIARYERGEPVRMPIPKLRFLCQALKFSHEEIARIIARVQRTMFADDRDETSEVISFASVAMEENTEIKGRIRDLIGTRKIEDVPGDEMLWIVHAAITEYLSPLDLPYAAATSTRAAAAQLPAPPAPSVAAGAAQPKRRKAQGGRQRTIQPVRKV